MIAGLGLTGRVVASLLEETAERRRNYRKTWATNVNAGGEIKISLPVRLLSCAALLAPPPQPTDPSPPLQNHQSLRGRPACLN